VDPCRGATFDELRDLGRRDGRRRPKQHVNVILDASDFDRRQFVVLEDPAEILPDTLFDCRRAIQGCRFLVLKTKWKWSEV
jgi:hypothetical protein